MYLNENKIIFQNFPPQVAFVIFYYLIMIIYYLSNFTLKIITAGSKLTKILV